MKNYYLVAFIFLVSFSVKAQCWQSVAIGNVHSAAIKPNGELWMWGMNEAGELGDGTNIDSNAVIPIGSDSDWQKITLGAEFTIAIKTDGTLWAWGRNNLGQLGDGTLVDKNIPTQIGTDTNWQNISAGISQTNAIKTDGTLWRWGLTDAGELQAGNLPLQVGTDSDWQQVSRGNGHSLAIKTNGTLWTFGSNLHGEFGYTNVDMPYSDLPIQIGTDNDWQAAHAGGGYSMALKSNGSLWTWGWNHKGQLGNGNTTSTHMMAQVPGEWKSISAGGGFQSHAVKNDDTLWAWGFNGYGHLGDGTTSDSSIPIQIGTAQNWLFATGNGFHTAALTTESIWIWGWNFYGQLGNETNIDSPVPLQLICPELGTGDIPLRPFTIYPNPVEKLLYLENNENQPIDRIIVYDCVGKEIALPQADNLYVDVENLQNGIYFIHVICGDNTYTQQFIKQ